MQPIVTLQHISVVYDHEKPVLTDVNLTIYDRDFIGVIGPNGGGKTTLVKTILKSLTYTGEVIYSPEIESKGYRRIGYLPQNGPYRPIVSHFGERGRHVRTAIPKKNSGADTPRKIGNGRLNSLTPAVSQI